MCGIAGYVGRFAPGLAQRMNSAQVHRGPDGRGVFEDPAAEIALGHTRLAILDLTPAGAQPMHSADGRFVLVYNGEIYNFRELRDDLQARGHRFASTGDSAVLLAGLAEYGAAFVRRLNGMFAFALWDRRERELLLARDHLGVKPLYWTSPEPGTVLFASEIKALFGYDELSREPDFVALQQHLAYCHASDDRTALRAVKRLPPGHCLRWSADRRTVKLEPYWRPRPREAPMSRARATAELRDALERAVTRQLVSDVPVGAFLSGGLDSGLITRFAADRAAAGFRCYTVVPRSGDATMDTTASDAPHARALARRLGLPLFEIELAPAVADLLPWLVYHLDEPIADPAIISCYLVCKLAREGGTPVLLSGQGADELLCGYPRYPAVEGLGWLDALPLGVRRALARGAGVLPGAREGALGTASRRVKRVLSESEHSPEERFLALCASTPEAEITRILGPAFRDGVGGARFSDDCCGYMAEHGLAGLARFRDRDLGIYLPNHNLLYTDKMGMAVGIEARVPFLDVDLVESVLGYPMDWVLRGRTTKAILRDAARNVVPDDVVDRPKAGFGAPYRKWLRYDLAGLWDDLTGEALVRRRGWFDHRALQDARARSQSGRVDLYLLQWAVLTIELWARRFVDHNPLSE